MPTPTTDRPMKNFGRRSVFVLLAFALGLGSSACTDTLVEPRSEVTSANIFTDTASYTSFLAKLYGGHNWTPRVPA